jgi:hypothetical protein
MRKSGRGRDPHDQSGQDVSVRGARRGLRAGGCGAREPDETEGNADYASGEGSRCRSNGAGAKAFEAALATSPSVSPAERAALTSAREALAPSCNDAAAPAAYAAPAGIVSPLGRQFRDYLAGTAGFYDGDFDGARRQFVALTASSQPWLKETASYMLGRVAVNKAQVAAFDDYGVLNRDNVDRAALADAEQAFQAYLRDYPQGLYAASARGLTRRVDWLGGEPQKLAADYAHSFADPDERNVSAGELVLEADSKLMTKVMPRDVGEPMLLATLDLMAMRTASPDAETPPAVIKFDDLAAQKPTFAGAPDLYEYLLAAHRFYVEKDPAGALAHLGSAAPVGPISELAFSSLTLRGLALEARKDWVGARQLWLQMLPNAQPAFQRPMLELALAGADEQSGRLADVFVAGSQIRDPQVREILLRHDAGPALLIQRIRDEGAAARERRVARYILLYKDVMRGRYAAFASDAALAAPAAEAPPNPGDPLGAEPDPALFDWPGTTGGYPCANLRQLVQDLQAAPRRAHNLLCLGDFARQKDLDGDPLNASAPAGELGSAHSQFPGRSFARLDAYKLIIADPKALAADRAYALYRAINCFASVGRNRCDGVDVPLAERKRWFQTLKHDYAGSVWAADQKYYW